jgi:hypothetical protein
MSYEIVEEKDISLKAFGNKLPSEYSSADLNSLPTNIRKIYKIVVHPDVSKEELKSILTQVVKDKTSKDNNIDEIAVFAYDRKDDIKYLGFTFGRVLWCPNGNWAGVTPEIASIKDRFFYQYVFEIKDKVGNLNPSKRPTTFEYEIWDNYMLLDNEPQNAELDEDLIKQKIAEKYGIPIEEVRKIYDKVFGYLMN